MGLTHSPGVVTIGPGNNKAPLSFKITVVIVLITVAVAAASYIPATFWNTLILKASIPLN